MTALRTDLYQITMAAGYFQSGKVQEKAAFELFVRRLPSNREYLIAAGLEQAAEFLLELHFTGDQIDFLRGLKQFEHVKPAFWEYLRAFRFTGNLFAMQEGTPFYPGEPIMTIHAPIIEAQIPETFLLSTVSYQSNVATKAARIVEAAQGRAVVEFGTRRAHSPEAGVLAGRSAFIGGCVGTSNVEAGFRFGVPIFGTAAHSWVQAFPTEGTAFKVLQDLLGPSTTYLIDTYDTLQGARKAAGLGNPLWGVRLDSGDLVSLSKSVRGILDEAGLPEAKIMASNDLNEFRITELLAAGAAIDAFGVAAPVALSREELLARLAANRARLQQANPSAANIPPPPPSR